MIQITALPANDDNYIYMVYDEEHMIAIDPGQAEPVLAFLNTQQRTLSLILNTHMHQDHCAGNLTLKRETACHIASGDERVVGLDLLLHDGIRVPGLSWDMQVLSTPGHTQADCSFYLPEAQALFTGDTLFSGGCGRVFEGTMEQLYASLCRLAAFPEDTRLFCGHEYTEDNYRFAASIEPDSAEVHDKLSRVRALRQSRQSTLPVTLGEELQCNPFLRCDDPALRRALKQETAAPVEVFCDLRLRKNRF